jgi:flagella basal body P-ring formation protein FlgA
MIDARRMTKALIALAALGIFAAPAVAAGRISVKERSEVASANILVGDIASVSGIPVAERDRITGLSVGPAPRPNEDATYNAAQIKGRLYNAGIAIDTFELDIPAQVAIHRKATIVRGAELAAGGIEFIRNNIPWRKENLDVAFKSEPEDIVLPFGDVKIEYVMDSRPHRYGVQSFLARIYQNGDLKRVMSLTGFLRVMADVVVAANDIDAGHVLRADDLGFQKIDLTNLRPGAYDSEDSLIGKQVVRKILRGDVIVHATVSEIPDIKAGDPVSIIFRGAGFEVAAKGKAVEKGFVGETVKVINEGSRKVLDAVVLDSQTVEIVAH